MSSLCSVRLLCLTIVLAFMVPSLSHAQARAEKIDPMKPGVFEFLDTDLSVHADRARKAYLKGNFEKAAREYLFILSHDYKDVRAMYNLACCYGRMEEAALASQMLLRAVRAGYRNIDAIRAEDDFEGIRDEHVFVTTLEHIETWLEGLGGLVLVRGEKAAPCRIRVPGDYDGGRSYPLIVALHGHGGCSENFIQLFDLVPNAGFILAAPEGLYEMAGSTGSRHRHYSWDVAYQDETLWSWADPLTVAYILNVVQGVSAQYSVDGVYVMGFSQGAAYAYMTAILHPAVFDGMVCVSGILPKTDTSYSMISDSTLAAACGLPVFIAHSREDKALEYEQGIWAKQRLEKLGYDVTFFDYPGGHIIPAMVMQEVARWISERDP